MSINQVQLGVIIPATSALNPYLWAERLRACYEPIKGEYVAVRGSFRPFSRVKPASFEEETTAMQALLTSLRIGDVPVDVTTTFDGVHISIPVRRRCDFDEVQPGDGPPLNTISFLYAITGNLGIRSDTTITSAVLSVKIQSPRGPVSTDSNGLKVTREFLRAEGPTSTAGVRRHMSFAVDNTDCHRTLEVEQTGKFDLRSLIYEMHAFIPVAKTIGGSNA